MALQIEDFHLRDYVADVPDEDLAGGKRHILKRSVRFGNDFLPGVAARVREVDVEDVPFGRFPVGAHEKLAVLDLSEEARLRVVDDWLNRLVGLQILEIEIAAGASRAVNHGNQKVMAIGGK